MNTSSTTPTTPDKSQQKAIDFALVEKARAGDRRAFGKLVETYQQRIYAVAFGILRNREDAWDAAQEAFVKAYKNLDKFKGDSAFYTWMYRIAYNLSIDHLRSKKRKRTVDLNETKRMEEALRRTGKKPEGNPDDVAGRKELSGVLHDAMNQLSDKHRAIIVLREVEGLSYEEIAEVLGIAKGTVMSRLFHARKNLQELLEPYVDQGNAIVSAVGLAPAAS